MATTDLGTVYVILKGNNAHLTASLKKSKSQVKSFAASVKRSMKGMSASVTNIINRSFNQIFHFMKRVAEAAIIAFAAMGYAIVKFASDAKESENLFTQSMRGMADSTRKWSDDLSKALFLNAFEVRRNVGLFNVMLKSMGATSEQAQSMAQNFTQLAYDMASFYNISDEQAFGALKSGITGLVKPLKALGILINVEILEEYIATHKEFADQIGYNGKQLTMLQKVLVRNQVIFIAARTSMGDLARTQKDWMQITRAIRQQLKLLGINLGQVVLPALEKFGIKIRDYFVKDRNIIVGYFMVWINLIKRLIPAIKIFMESLRATFLELVIKAYLKLKELGNQGESLAATLWKISYGVYLAAEVMFRFWGVIFTLVKTVMNLVHGLELLMTQIFGNSAAVTGFARQIGALALAFVYLRINIIKIIWDMGVWIGIQIKSIALSAFQAIMNSTLITSYIGLGSAMYGVSVAAGVMWAAITGPIGWVLAALALAAAGITLLVSETAAEKVGGSWIARKLLGGGPKLNKLEKEDIRENEISRRQIKVEKEMKKAMEENMKKFKKMQDEMAKEMKSRIQEGVDAMGAGASEEDRINQEQLDKEKAKNKEKLSDYKRTLKNMRDAQKELVGVLGPGDITFQTSRRQAEKISGVGYKTAEREQKLVEAIEKVEKAIKNEGTKTREEITY